MSEPVGLGADGAASESALVDGRRRAVELFEELCDLEEPARELRLAEVAAVEPALARAVAGLLARDDVAVGPLERLRGAVAAVTEAASARRGDDATPPFVRL